MNRNTDFIPFARPSFSKEEEAAVLEVLRSGWVTTGKAATELEQRVAEASHVKHALAVNSATSGLHLALEASGVGEGDYVITSPYTFTASAEVIRYCGAHPLFVDIEKDGYNISPENIERAAASADSLNGRIAAIMPVHVGGETCKRREILAIAEKAGAAVIEDGAHLQPGPLLTDDNSILVYSFYATKCITTGEGGMVITNNDEAAARMKTMRFHGIDREAWNRYRAKGDSSWNYDITAAGFKYNLPDLLAAIGTVQMDRADEMLKKRQDIAARYDRAFGSCSQLKIPESCRESSRHLYILRIVPEQLSIGRDELISVITEKGIGLSVHYRPLHMMSYYADKYSLQPQDFPEALKRFENSFSIPIYPDLTEEEISRIINTILNTCSRYRRD
ncbi:MAG: DegT/DnrJ/EryC1/StrS aminotransferase family protein [Spirochaetales bacterium]|uniref:DegT/DnrJ/EryC1/StrS aminotransferase family protein n=1 Tax=Candidatus Thalassospirochaeta sargassi TaxID=3119039 RepID=A0AAJ1IF68_9SPIO|nr:DegT/DnrJ/EryC1/StrS aminotransferase family protein [Spirochaetales bacterium]